MWYHFIPTTTASNNDNTNHCQDVQQLELSCLAEKSGKWFTLENALAVSNTFYTITYVTTILLLGTFPRKMKKISKKTCLRIFTAVFWIISRYLLITPFRGRSKKEQRMKNGSCTLILGMKVSMALNNEEHGKKKNRFTKEQVHWA